MLLLSFSAQALDERAFDDPEAAQAALALVNQEITALEQQLARDRPEQARLEQELKATATQIASISQTLQQLETEIQEYLLQLEQLVTKKTLTETDIQAQRSELLTVLQQRYRLGFEPAVKLVLNLDNPATLNRLLTYMDYLNQVYAEQIQTLTHALIQLEEVEASMLMQTTALQAAQQEQSQLEDMVRAEYAEQDSLYQQLSEVIASRDQQLNERLIDQQNLTQIVDALQAAIDSGQLGSGVFPDFEAAQGHLSWPTLGRLQAEFGQEGGNDAAVDYQGIVIAADEGQSVVAVDAGRVVFADWLRGYGFLLIIEHGEGFMTLYGHNQSLYQGVGAWVNRGDLIGEVGKSGIIGQPGLYFEIRQEGKPIDPLLWLSSERS